MDISFVIISDGKKSGKLAQQIFSIYKQSIPNYEIVIAGNVPATYANGKVKVIPDVYNAERGSLGGLRNTACLNTKYENLVISDDDMFFPTDWYKNLVQTDNFDILTTRIKNPDGTRFWDHACFMSPVRGHIILNPDEDDDHLYMSGGQSWLMKKYVWDKIQWDAELLFYNMKGLSDYDKGIHNEDTNFSLRCREAGFKISYDHRVKVFHNDATYTSIGRLVRRRSLYDSQKWVQNFLFPEERAVEFAVRLAQTGIEAEAADILRKLKSQGSYLAMKTLMDFENHYGGPLQDSEFLIDNPELDV